MTGHKKTLALLALGTLLAAGWGQVGGGDALAQQPPAPQESPDRLYKIPGQNPATSKDEVQLYMDAQDEIRGTVSIPDAKLSLLVQPEGRDWRQWRTSTLQIVSAVLVLGMIAAVLVFFLVKGRIRIEGGRSGRMIPRFGTVERFAHWATATSFLILALTGLVVTFGRPLLIPLIGHSAFTATAEATKYLHNFFSVPFVVGVLMMLVLWVRDNIPERADLEWVKTGGGFLRKGSQHPEVGRFNAGQKGIFWSVVLGGLLMAVSGYMLMLPFFVTTVSGMQWMHVVHGVLGAILMAIIVAHIYIGSLGMEGAFDAMGRGEVDENWAVEHHGGWYQQMRGRLGLRTPPRRAPVVEVEHRGAGAD
jgi:formate dehydrogenase subunit gamma